MPKKILTEEDREKQRKYSRDHYKRNKKSYLDRNREKKANISSYIRQYKEHHGCMDCGGKFPYYVLDLDHRVGTDKKFTPSHLHRTNSWDKMIAELDKCDVVCANCHRARTHSRGYTKEDVI